MQKQGYVYLVDPPQEIDPYLLAVDNEGFYYYGGTVSPIQNWENLDVSVLLFTTERESPKVPISLPSLLKGRHPAGLSIGEPICTQCGFFGVALGLQSFSIN